MRTIFNLTIRACRDFSVRILSQVKKLKGQFRHSSTPRFLRERSGELQCSMHLHARPFKYYVIHWTIRQGHADTPHDHSSSGHSHPSLGQIVSSNMSINDAAAARVV